MVRAKFVVTEVTEYESGGGKRIKLEPRYSKSIPEDQRFAEATPSGDLTMYVTNPTALKELTAGRVFYIDFTLAPEGTSRLHE